MKIYEFYCFIRRKYFININIFDYKYLKQIELNIE